MKKVMIIPGDGVGPEVVSATHKVLRELTDEIEFLRFDAGLKYYKEQGYSMSRALLDAAKDCDAVLLGTIMKSDERGYVDPEEEIKRFLGLTAHIHRTKDVVPGLAERAVDTYVITPNEIINPITEMEDVDGITRHVRMQYHNSRTVFNTAVTLARQMGMKRIACVNYTPLFKMTSTRYRDGFHNTLSKSGMDLSDMYMEDFAPSIIRDHATYDVITTPLVYSHMINSILASLVGGIHLTAIEDYDRESAVFKPAHGPMPELAGMDRVNPIGSMMAGSMMLKHFGMFEESETLEEAIASACRRGYMTPDLGGQSSRTEFVDQVLSFCRK